MSINPEEDLIKNFLNFNNLLKNNDYVMNILDTKFQLKSNYIINDTAHINNFKSFINIIKRYNDVYNHFDKYINKNEYFYLYKCFYDLTIIFLINISGFNQYLNILYDYYNNDTNETQEKHDKIFLNYLSNEKQNFLNYGIIPINILESDIYLENKILYFEKLLAYLNLTNITYRNTNYFNIDINDLKNYKNNTYTNILILDNTYYTNIDNIIKFYTNIGEYIDYIIDTTIKNLIIINDKIIINNPKYISIPQYTTICWFIATITGICYSDLNKKLLLDKEKSNNQNKNIFITFIYTIINNITKDFKQYNEHNYNIDCNIFKFLKYEPIKVLNYLIKNKYKDFIKHYKLINQYGNTSNFIQYLEYKYINKLSKFGYFAQFIKLNKITKKSQIKNNNNNYGLGETLESILIYIYDLLNITTNFLYINDNNDIFINRTDYIENIPDILIIQYNNLIDYYKSSLFSNINKNILLNDETIIYKNNKYKLDYILHSDNYDYPCTINSCGHCICAITYNGEQYIHDSNQAINYIKCDNDTIKIPCLLIKQNWNKNLKKEITYCIDKCYYNIDCNYNSEYKANLCYTFNKNFIYVYVKI